MDYFNSVDCAIAVMYYMTELFAGRILYGSVRSNVIRDMRANVAEMFARVMCETDNVHGDGEVNGI